MEGKEKVTDYCFGCGRANPVGLKLEFAWQGDVLHAEFTPREEHQGYPGMTHGGIIATLLDEIMANALFQQGILVVTAEMTVRYIHKVPTGRKVHLYSRVVRRHKRLYEVEGWLADETGRELARGRSKMLEVDRESTLRAAE